MFPVKKSVIERHSKLCILRNKKNKQSRNDINLTNVDTFLKGSHWRVFLFITTQTFKKKFLPMFMSTKFDEITQTVVTIHAFKPYTIENFHIDVFRIVDVSFICFIFVFCCMKSALSIMQ